MGTNQQASGLVRLRATAGMLTTQFCCFCPLVCITFHACRQALTPKYERMMLEAEVRRQISRESRMAELAGWVNAGMIQNSQPVGQVVC